MPRRHSISSIIPAERQIWRGLVIDAELAFMCEKAGGRVESMLTAEGLRLGPHLLPAPQLVVLVLLEALNSCLHQAGEKPSTSSRAPGCPPPSRLAFALGVPEPVADAIVRALLDLHLLLPGPPHRFAAWIWWRAVAAASGGLRP